MADDACFVFFIDGRYDLDAAAVALAERGLTIRREPDELSVSFPGKPVLRVGLASDKYVQDEAIDISIGSLYAAELPHCRYRFEILIDDLPSVLSEINTLIDVQDALQQLTHGFLYRTWNGSLSGPDQAP